MRRVVCALLVLAAGSATAVTAASQLWQRPAPYAPGTGRLVATTGAGRYRLSLFVGRSKRGELCLTARLGSSARPPGGGYTCLRRGLEPPALPIEMGGEDRSGRRSAAVVGLVDGTVRDVEIDLQDNSHRLVRLRPAPGLRGWRTFAFGPTTSRERGNMLMGSLPDSLVVHDHSGATLSEQASIILLAPCELRNACGNSGGVGDAPWTKRYDWFAAGVAGTDGRTTDLALRFAPVRKILADHPAWLDEIEPWTSCNGRLLGAAIALRFRRPATFGATLPFVAAPQGHAAYASGVHDVMTVASPGLNIWVDSNRGRVVGVDSAWSGPLDSGGVEMPLHVRVPPRDAGGPDNGDCWTSHG